MDWILTKIRDFRKQKGYSQEEIADILGIEQKTYSNWERGRTEMTLQNLNKIADALKIDRKALWDETAWISKPYKKLEMTGKIEDPETSYRKYTYEELETKLKMLEEQNIALTRAYNELFEKKKMTKQQYV